MKYQIISKQLITTWESQGFQSTRMLFIITMCLRIPDTFHVKYTCICICYLYYYFDFILYYIILYVFYNDIVVIFSWFLYYRICFILNKLIFTLTDSIFGSTLKIGLTVWFISATDWTGILPWEDSAFCKLWSMLKIRILTFCIENTLQHVFQTGKRWSRHITKQVLLGRNIRVRQVVQTIKETKST